MPDFINVVFKILHLPIPVKKDLPSNLISTISLKDIKIRLPKDLPHPLITGFISTEIHIPKLLRKVEFITTEIKAEFYLLHPKSGKRIAKLETDGWHESSFDKSKYLWRIEVVVEEAPVEIVDERGFDEWIGIMIEHEGETMNVSVEGWCSAGIKVLGTKARIQKLPIKASLDIPGITTSH